uniref:serine hydrolase domain-containing protein n=1 Tax=uncultured Sphingomonas sp. TaxID=158754 RepID=UPI0035C964AB
MTDARLAGVDAFYQTKVDDGRIAGIAYAVAGSDGVIHQSAIGYADLEAGTPLALDTVFRLYSMTKPLTAVALMLLYEDDRFSLDEPIANYLPEFAELRVLRSATAAPDDTVPAAHPISIRDVLRHTAGLGLGLGMGGAGEQLLAREVMYQPDETLADQMRKVARTPLCWQPGSVWQYSLAPDLQARLVEILSGQPFDAFLQQRVLDPLGMADTSFAPRPDMVDRLTKLYRVKDDALASWSPEDPPALPFDLAWPAALVDLNDTSLHYIRGAFGLYSTLGDYLRFARMLLNGGTFEGQRILAPETLALMTTDQLGDIPMLWDVQGLGFGLGFALIRDPAKTLSGGTAGTFYWDGAAGTVFWVDPERDLAVVAMVQHLLVPGVDPHALDAELHHQLYPALFG